MDPVYKERVEEVLEGIVKNALDNHDYRLIEFSICKGKTPYHKKEFKFMILNDDLSIDGQDMFSGKEAYEIHLLAMKYGARLPRAHEARGIGFWITFGGEYVQKFGFDHAGHTWEDTDIPQTQDEAAYYWTASRNHNDDQRMRAMRVYKDGQFDTPYRPIGEKMKIRLIIDPDILKKNAEEKKAAEKKAT